MSKMKPRTGRQQQQQQQQQQTQHNGSECDQTQQQTLAVVTKCSSSSSTGSNNSIGNKRVQSVQHPTQSTQLVTLILWGGLLTTLLCSCVMLISLHFVTSDYHLFINHHDSQLQNQIKQQQQREENKQKELQQKSNNDGKEKVFEIFAQAGITLNETDREQLPTWQRVLDMYGPPIVFNQQSCAAFRRAIPGVERNIGANGMFNTGTNLATQLLKQNCKIPERVEKYGLKGPFHDSQGKSIGPFEAHGMRWQVPWGKHLPVRYRNDHSTKYAKHICKNCTLPIVTIRHPYRWFLAMCRHHYNAFWPHNTRRLCPNLVKPQTGENISVHVKYDKHTDVHDNLATLWNDWYSQYTALSIPSSQQPNDDDFLPFIMVRFEDLIFHSQNITTQMCTCAGGVMNPGPFHHIIDSAKEGPGHGIQKGRTGMLKAWIKFTQSPSTIVENMRDADYKRAVQSLDSSLMSLFRYQHPPQLSQQSAVS